jgi:ATP-binding cassette, subfamily C (CFTR/MRP), member 1
VISIFDKMLELRSDSSIESRAVTLMISDVQRIVHGLSYMHEVWAGVLEAAFATWLLQRQWGPSCFTMLGLALGIPLVPCKERQGTNSE